jgi:hypothetical protein
VSEDALFTVIALEGVLIVFILFPCTSIFIDDCWDEFDDPEVLLEFFLEDEEFEGNIVFKQYG